MKNLLLFFVLLIPFLVSGEVEYAISHDQYYVIPENADSAWIVGQFHANVSDTMIHARSGSYSFSIVSGNTGTAFAINSSSGMITINNKSAFYGGGDDDYTLGIQVSIDSETETRNAYIHVVDEDNCDFIDLDAGNGGDGSKGDPYNTFSDISSLIGGHAAFIKRGSDQNTYSQPVTLGGTFSAGSPFYLAAYGIGDKPEFINTSNYSGGYYQGVSFNTGTTNVRVYDLVTKNFNGNDSSLPNSRWMNGFHLNTYVTGVLINRCESTNSGKGGEFYCNSYTEVIFRDCKGWDNDIEHIFKLQGSNSAVISCTALGANTNSFSFPQNDGSDCILAYSYGSDAAKNIVVRKENMEVAYNYLTGGYVMMDVYIESEESDIDSIYIHHNIFYDSNNTHGINLINGSDIRVCYNIVTDCVNGIRAFSTVGSNLKIYNNVSYNNTTDIVIDKSGVEFQNNIYQTASGSYWPSPAPAYNWDIDNGDPFVNKTNNDFHLDSVDATGLIDQGYNYGTAVDLDGVSVPQYGGWDIGAYEHPGGTTPPAVTVSITKSTDAYEQNEASGTFTVSRTGSTSDSLVVSLGTPGGSAAIGIGNDYTISHSGTVTINIGNSSATVTVYPNDDDDVEGTETVTLSITSGEGYSIGTSSASMNLYDNDEDMLAHWPFEEGSGTSTEDITVNSYDGTLTNGAAFSGDAEVGSYSVLLDGDNDYVGTGTIDLGSEFTVCMWAKIPTSGVSNIQTLFANSASGGITDGMRVFVDTYGTTDQKIIVETANGSSSNTASTATSTFDFDQWNHVAIAVDKTNGKCRIYYNGSIVTTDSTIRDDFATNQTFHLGQMTNNSWTMKGNLDDVRIYDSFLTEAEVDEIMTGDSLQTVTISATDSIATEAGQTTGTYRISRGSETSGNLTVNLSASGTATPTTDYGLSDSGSVTISDGNTYAEITLTPVDDSTVEGDETVILTVTSGTGYTVGTPSSATVTIIDDDFPEVTIRATDATATEESETTGTFTVSRYPYTSGNLTVNLGTPTGTATLNTDYTISPSGTIVISNGDSIATITVTPDDDATVESSETVIQSLSSGSGYTVGSTSSATVTIVDNDSVSSYEDPIAHWKFESVDPNDDEMDNYDLTLVNSPSTYSTGGFDGDGYISFNCGDCYAYSPTINLGSVFTITGWYKFNGTTQRTLVANGTHVPDGFWLSVIGSTGQFEFLTGNGTDTISARSVLGSHTNSVWVHFAVVVDRTNGTCNIYVDGADVTFSSSIRTDFENNAAIRLARTTNDNFKLYGYMDDVRVYDYLVDASDIEDIYDGTKKAHVSLNEVGSTLSVFPLPFTDVFTVKGAAQVKQIEVMNICGKSILVKDNPGNSVFKVNMSGLPAGYYIMRLTDNNNDISIQKLIKK